MDVGVIEEQLRERISGTINHIANRDYAKILNFVNLDNVAMQKDLNEQDSVKELGNDIDLQVDGSKDDVTMPYNPIVIDQFDEHYSGEGFDEIAEELVEGEVISSHKGTGKYGFYSYCLFSNGEEIDYMNMEFRIVLRQDNKLDIYMSWNL